MTKYAISGDDKLLISDINDSNKNNLICPKCNNRVIFCNGESRTYFRHHNRDPQLPDDVRECDYYIYGENDYNSVTDEDAALCCIVTTLSFVTCICCVPPLILFCDWIDSE